MEGQKHEDKLHSSVPVDVFVDGLDSWCPGVVLVRTEEEVPHTSVRLLRFRVQYSVDRAQAAELQTQPLPHLTLLFPEPKTGAGSGTAFTSGEGDSGDVVTVEEAKVKSDRLRLVRHGEPEREPEPGPLDDSSSLTAAAPATKSLLEMTADEYMAHMAAQQQTWSTVAVSVVDENAPSQEPEPEPEPEPGRAGAVGLSKKAAGERVRLAKDISASLEANDDALATYDPYNTNSYKGYKLGDDVVQSYEVNSLTGVSAGTGTGTGSGTGAGAGQRQSLAPKPSFKKRKRNNAIRTTTSED